LPFREALLAGLVLALSGCGARSGLLLGDEGGYGMGAGGTPPLGAAGAGGAGPTPATAATQVTVGAGIACALSSDQRIVCWADPWVGVTITAPAGRFVDVSTTANHACAVRTNGSVVCWPPGL
jgi:hypothetical protein